MLKANGFNYGLESATPFNLLRSKLPLNLRVTYVEGANLIIMIFWGICTLLMLYIAYTNQEKQEVGGGRRRWCKLQPTPALKATPVSKFDPEKG